MNATTLNAAAVPTGSPTFLGLRNLMRKDVSEWLNGKRPWVVLALTSAVFVFAAANSAIQQWVIANVPADASDGPAKALDFVPIDNLLMAIGTQFSIIAVIFATMSTLVTERESGTLAWTISKPVSRTSVLVSKWLTATVALWLVAIVIPIVLTAITVAALYGVPDLRAVGLLVVLLVAVPAIFVAITVTAATFVSSQAAVGAIGFAAFVLPSILGGIAPGLASFFPTSIFGWALAVATGSPAPVVTPIAWAAAIVGLLLLARWRFSQTDL